ncbi:6-phosphogluconolactonase [Chthoniobacter flavus Ellin428]|uniref:6-phosphogluconolactonase n=1 Tax=Chthoniobacter flavus Ellin428 TaxID=497964 RepID=B4DAH7_9BACT|nr:6-phosphogluconolactonase [Chthoniobacter flavus]EDY16495.1 6-phosphogluconolactonase [Chthoniobacter flavus Ellin428]TCO85245.1 6-phosphogluconolactonase [Chthoniobacter flavus]
MISRILHSKDFAADAARTILDHARKAIAERGLFRLGLTGGRSPRAIHAALLAQAGDLPWKKVQLTFGDERCVPPDHEDSNYRVAKETLIDPSGIPEGNVFRMRGEIDPETAAREYEDMLRAFAGRLGEPRYAHDLLLLGLGEDGHTASLFPGSPALDETTREVLPVIGPKPPPQRLSMTFPLINASHHVLFLVPQADKRAIAEAAVAGDQRYPASRVHGQEYTTWLLGT